MRKLGLPVDVSPSKLTSGFGEAVCTILHMLCMRSVESRIKFKKPVIRDDGGFGGDEDADELGDEFEGNADVADIVREAEEDGGDDIDDDLDIGGGQGGAGHDDEQL